jgi:hypothetical protein
MVLKTKIVGVALILALGLWGVSGCLDQGTDDDGGPDTGSVSVSGTWTGTSSNAVTVSGGCGGGQGGDAFTVSATLVQSGATVTGTAMAEGQTFAVLNGAVGDSSFTFNIDVQDGSCSSQSNQFTCPLDSITTAAMWCRYQETHCDSCGGGQVTHTVRQTFNFIRQ